MVTTKPILAKAKAAVYAEVLLKTAPDPNSIFELASQFDQLLKTVRGSAELALTLANQHLAARERRAIAHEVFIHLRPELLAVFEVMVERGDLDVLARAHAQFERRAEQALGVVIIDVTTVVPLDERLRSLIIKKYASQLGSGVRLREHVDPGLAGGIILSLHGRRIDASVVSQLQSARSVLIRP